MSENFVPTSAMERAFIQAQGVAPEQLRKCAWQSLELGLTEAALGQFLCAAKGYALSQNYDQQKDITNLILENIAKLDSDQVVAKHSICRICRSIADSLFEVDEPLGAISVVLVIRVMVTMVRSIKEKGLRALEMLALLQAACQSPVGFEELAKLELQCEQISSGWGVQLPVVHRVPPRSTAKFQDTFSPSKKQTELQRLDGDLAKAADKFGMRSTEVTLALVELLHYYTKFREPLVPSKFLDQLASLCSLCLDDSIELTAFQLRRAYTVSGQLRNENKLLAVLEELERSLFLRRIELVGFDSLTCIALNRLVEIWIATDNVSDGALFCKQICQRASEQLDYENFIMGQLRSAHVQLEELLEEANDRRQIDPGVGKVHRYEEPEEFIPMLALMAMDLFNVGHLEQVENVLNELLVYYRDCVGDKARQVGEMIWLLIETELRTCDGFVKRLIETSLEKANDAYLIKRLCANIERVVTLTKDESMVKTLLQNAIVLVNAKRSILTPRNDLGILGNFHSFLIYTQKNQNAVASETSQSPPPDRTLLERSPAVWKFISRPIILERLRLAVGKASEQKAKKLFSAGLWLCRNLVAHHEFRMAIAVFDILVSAETKPFNFIESRQILALATICYLHRDFSGAGYVLQTLCRHISELSLPQFDAELVKFQEALLKAGMPRAGITIFKYRLSMNFPDDQSTNRLRVRAAALLLLDGNTFESAACLSQAYSAMFEPYPFDQQQGPLQLTN